MADGMGEITLDDVRDIALARRAVREGFARPLREAAGVTQREGARIIRVSQGALCKWEAGKRVPSAALAARYGRFLRELRDV